MSHPAPGGGPARRLLLIAVVVALLACAAPDSSPSPEPEPEASPTPSPIGQPTPNADPPVVLVNTPRLSYLGSHNFRSDTGRFTEYLLAVSNWTDYPSEWLSVPDAPTCATLRDAATNEQLTSYCPLGSAETLGELSFSLPRRQAPPASVYLELTNLMGSVDVRSESVLIEQTTAGQPSTPSPTAGPDGWIGPARISTNYYDQLSLVVDDNGVAHAAAVRAGEDGVFYLTNDSGSWTRKRLRRPRDFARAGGPFGAGGAAGQSPSPAPQVGQAGRVGTRTLPG